MPELLTENHLRLAVLNEDLRLKPYTDTVGKLTIGIGRNLTDVGISTEEAHFLCRNDLQKASAAAVDLDPWVTWLDPVRRAAVIDLTFNMGRGKWKTFGRTRNALARGEFELAVRELKDSRWWRQVGVRGPRIARMLLTGKWPWET